MFVGPFGVTVAIIATVGTFLAISCFIGPSQLMEGGLLGGEFVVTHRTGERMLAKRGVSMRAGETPMRADKYDVSLNPATIVRALAAVAILLVVSGTGVHVAQVLFPEINLNRYLQYLILDG